MKKIFKSFFLMMMIVFSAFSMTGCTGSFFGSDEQGIQIESITSEELEDGSMLITITYTDEDREPTTFLIPKAEDGEPGKDGNGIQGITYTLSKDGLSTIVTITYTDQSIEPTQITIPNGISVTGVNYTVDEITGNTLITLQYSDGTTSDPIPVFKGEQGEPGEDGNSIVGIDQIVNDDDSVTLIFHFSKSEDYIVQIPAPHEGRGIDTIVAGETNDQYTMTIYYSDGTDETLTWDKPNPNQWYTGSEPSNSLGVDGDFYFDIYHHNIYVKQSGVWVLIVSFDNNIETHSVIFQLNDSLDEPANMPSGSLMAYQIPHGSYFAAQEGYTIPIPTRNGYDFVGWYTTKTITPTSGKFTDLTPVMADLTLYAIWEKQV